MNEPHKSSRSLRTQNVVRLLLLLAILILLNVISGFIFTRFDLTSEKRFTLSPATLKQVGDLEDVVYVRVYLEGDFPPAFRKLQQATKEMLDELRAYSKGNIEYEFINPSEHPDVKERNKVFQQLMSKGIQPTNLQARNKSETSEQIIFPGAMLSYRGEELPVMLLQDQVGVQTEQLLNNSIQGLEYNLANGIRKIVNRVPQNIAIIDGHREASPERLADITRELLTFYTVERIRINENLKSLSSFKAAIIAAPDSTFSEKDKFIIDQFIIKGGKVLWFVDGMRVSMDSLQSSDETIALANDLNLSDLLFHYGARINYDLVLDLQAAPIPVVTGRIGNRPSQSLMPWYYFPVVVPVSKHPIVNNLNAIKFDFVSSIDPVGSPSVVKTPLLTTSRYSRIFTAPARVSLEIMRDEPDEKLFSAPPKTVALLLEGKFTSNFKNRIPAAIVNDTIIKFKPESEFNQMIVVSDGDIIQNGYRKSTGAIVPLGLDRYTGQLYGNKSFIMNCIDYLCDDSGLMSVRSKELKLRLLDKTKLTESLTFWQVVNTGGPVLLIVVFGMIKFWRRKKKYATSVS